jgi:hypothetical protein
MWFSAMFTFLPYWPRWSHQNIESWKHKYKHVLKSRLLRINSLYRRKIILLYILIIIMIIMMLTKNNIIINIIIIIIVIINIIAHCIISVFDVIILILLSVYGKLRKGTVIWKMHINFLQVIMSKMFDLPNNKIWCTYSKKRNMSFGSSYIILRFLFFFVFFFENWGDILYINAIILICTIFSKEFKSC